MVTLTLLATAAYAQDCPAPISSDVIAATCGVENLEASLLKADEADCNWSYGLPDDQNRLLTVLRTTVHTPGEADFMSALAGALGGTEGGTQQAHPDLGDGATATTQSLPLLGTSHTVSFNDDGWFVEVKASGTPDMQGGDAATPFCTLEQVVELARHVAMGL